METETLEVLIREIKNWGENVAENSPSKYPDKMQMAAYLTECGADLGAVHGHEDSMKMWTDKGMSEAMEAIWGKKWEEVKKWNKDEYIPDYEATTGHLLPSIAVGKKPKEGQPDNRPRSKQSSMKHALGIMTRWAALEANDDLEFGEDRFREEIQVRVSNGLLRMQGINSKEDLYPLKRPDTKEIHHPSLPPDYVMALVDHLHKN